MATRSPMKSTKETDVTAPSDEKLDFDDDTLRAIADVYLHEGNSEYRKKELNNAVYFYTEGIQVCCKDDKLIAKLYSNRATAHFYLGNHQETLNDAKAAIQLEPTFIKAIERGASACVELHQFDEAITWCDKGLAINSTNKALLALRTRSAVQEVNKLPRATQEKVNSAPEGRAVESEKMTKEREYSALARIHYRQGDFKKAIHYHELRLKIVQGIGDRNSEGNTYGNLGVAYCQLGDFKKSITYHERDLEIKKEVGNRVGEGNVYANLALAHCSLGDFMKAKHYYERCLEIAIEVGDRVREGQVLGDIGVTYYDVGDFRKAIHYCERGLKIAKEVGDMTGEQYAYTNLGNAYRLFNDPQNAMRFHELALKLSKELGDRAGEGAAYANLGNVLAKLGDFEKAKDYRERHLKIAKELGDRAGEGVACCNLGSMFWILGDFKKAKCYSERSLQIAKEVGDKVIEAKSYCSLGSIFESLGSLDEACDCYQSSVRTLNEVRLPLKDEWKISLRHMYEDLYHTLWRILLRQGKAVEALFAAEQGRAQALNDLIELKYEFNTSNVESCTVEESIFDIIPCVSSSIIFTAVDCEGIIFWVAQKGRDVNVIVSIKELPSCKSTDEVTTFCQSLILSVREEIGVRSGIKCEDRSLDKMRDEKLLQNERSPQTTTHSSHRQTSALQTLYEIIFSPIADLVHGNELIIVPEGPLCLAPYAAFMDSNSKFLCESFRIRMIPSLSSLNMIANCPAGYHRKTGALLVGDPWVQDVIIDNQGNKFQQLPCAREEVELIGRILKTAPLIGRDATKNEVLSRLSSVALVHIAAHGRMETGEIALAPNPERPNRQPREEDYMLTMTDVMNVQLRARLVVLSCCHSGRGEIKAEGVVGIARAFLGAGARSVLVSLWAIDDEATMEFMKSFYQHLVMGRSASEALNRAMNSMRESDEFSEVKYWAPFVLLGDDVTLEFGGSE